MFDLYTPGDAMGLNYVSLSGLSVTFLLTVRIIFIIPCAEQELHTSQEIRKAEGIIEFIRVHQPNQRIAKQSACLCSRRLQSVCCAAKQHRAAPVGLYHYVYRIPRAMPSLSSL